MAEDVQAQAQAPLRSSTASASESAFSSHFIKSLRPSFLRITPSTRKLALLPDNIVIVFCLSHPCHALAGSLDWIQMLDCQALAKEQ